MKQNKVEKKKQISRQNGTWLNIIHRELTALNNLTTETPPTRIVNKTKVSVI